MSKQVRSRILISTLVVWKEGVTVGGYGRKFHLRKSNSLSLVHCVDWMKDRDGSSNWFFMKFKKLVFWSELLKAQQYCNKFCSEN